MSDERDHQKDLDECGFVEIDDESFRFCRTALPWYIRKVVELENRNADLEADNVRLREALELMLKNLKDNMGCGIGLVAILRAKKALSQKAGDRYEKMQAVVEAARIMDKHMYYDYDLDQAISTIERAIDLNDAIESLNDLEGGGVSE